MGFWMQLGLSGFRVDAVPFLLETKRQQDKLDLPDPHDYLADLAAFLRRRSGEAVLLGEVNLPYPDLMQFFGARDGGGSTDELTMCFDFIGMQAMYLSLARGDAAPLVDALKQRPEPPEDGHWATFVRNHDELTLDKLTDAQRQEVFAAFGPEEDMQLYGRGIRRRLPPMLDGDQRRIRLVYSLLFALPGTPVLFYGEEIGLGENLKVEGRLAVRVPMQWTADPGAGFSTADPSTFPEPLAEGEFGPEHVNVRDQSRDPDSLLSFFRHLVDSYRACPELAWGAAQVIDPGPDAAPVLAHRADADGIAIVALHNFADGKVTATLPLAGLAGCDLYDVLAGDGSTVTVGDDEKLEVTLPAYGHRWLRSAP
jgi:maltose alpha-D-glucosyltransferase/alpha-amylase